MRGVAGLVAGVFLLLFGLSTLRIFAPLARFRLRTPGFIMRWLGGALRRYSNPFVIGLLNGLMIICGPLQAMYIMAAGTGDPVEGAMRKAAREGPVYERVITIEAEGAPAIHIYRRN